MEEIKFSIILTSVIGLMTYAVTGVWEIALSFTIVMLIVVCAYQFIVNKVF